MAREKKKKYKNIKLEQSELAPTAIGIFENRKKSSVGIFLILIIFIVVVIFLPQISEAVNNYLNPKPENVGGEVPITPIPTPTPDPVEKDRIFQFSSNLTIQNDDITVNNFVVNNIAKTIKYDVTNNTSKYQNLGDLNYYLEIFNSEQTLMERVKLADSKNVSGGAFETFEKNINYETAANIGYVSLVKKKVTDYPEVKLLENELKNSTIVCTREHEKVTYKFTDGKLKEMVSEISYSNADLNYEEIYTKNKALVDEYSKGIGITSVLADYGTGYNISTIVDLAKAKRGYIFNADTFLLDTEAKVVSFEAEAQNFKCE